MTLDEKLRHITDENQVATLGSLTADELRKASRNSWLSVFKELKTLWTSDASLKQKREITRQIYPNFNYKREELDSFKSDTQQTFNRLMKSSAFLHAVHKWQQSPVEKRAEIAEILAHEVRSNMSGIYDGYVAPFNEYREDVGNTLAFVSPQDMQDIIHLNINPKVFEQKTLPSVLGILHHESTHLVQKHQTESRPELSAPYLDPTPEDKIKEHLEKDGYIFDENDTITYTHHPKEIEAYIKESKIQTLLQAELEKGLGKGLMKNHYNQELEEQKFKQDPRTNLGGSTEDTNPYRHLFAGVECAKKVLSSPIPQSPEVGDCIKHFKATIKYGEFLEDTLDASNPALTMLSYLGHYMKQPKFEKALKNSCYEKDSQSLLEECSKSPNPTINAKARLMLRLKKLEVEQSTQDPMTKQNKIDIRDAFRDRKPLAEIKSDKPNTLETEREKRKREIMEQMIGVKKGVSL